jgi:hypothetical protein
MSSPWSSILRYLRTRGGRSEDQVKDAHFELSDEDPKLPQFQKSRPSRGIITVRTELSTYRSLASIDDTYHEQLRRTYDESYLAKNPNASATHTVLSTNSIPRVYFAAPRAPRFSEQIYGHDQPDSTSHLGHSEFITRALPG